MLPAPAERCFEVLRDVTSWPRWYPYVTRASVLERAATGDAEQIELDVHVAAFRPSLLAGLQLQPPTMFRLERIAYDAGDDEALRVTVTLQPRGATCAARAEVDAAIDLPRLLPLPDAIADRIAADLLDALSTRVQDSEPRANRSP
jgi:ribosome-associated toxin RatA of RatAB toxin-antitoxin module